MRERDGPNGAAASQRRKELAAALATGLLRRCRTASKRVTPCSAESSESSPNCLGRPDGSRLSVPTVPAAGRGRARPDPRADAAADCGRG